MDGLPFTGDTEVMGKRSSVDAVVGSGSHDECGVDGSCVVGLWMSLSDEVGGEKRRVRFDEIQSRKRETRKKKVEIYREADGYERAGYPLAATTRPEYADAASLDVSP